MIRTLLFTIFLCIFVFIAGGSAAGPANAPMSDGDYFVADDEISIVLHEPKDNRPPYKVSIKRDFTGPKQERMLNIAEVVYPKAKTIETACNPHFRSERNLDSKFRWSCGAFDGTFTPFTITKGAVAYYLDLLSQFRRNDFQNSRGIVMSSASLSYHSSIRFVKAYRVAQKKLKNVYVISMKLSWSQYCGRLCAMGFNKERTVVLNNKGRVLEVEGDGGASMWVS
ncbi:MAG: hypothetical protein KDB79_15975 [Acidobacteria bacterium]|nr:hypothetical protein [Acidobacteriota bacterium]